MTPRLGAEAIGAYLVEAVPTAAPDARAGETLDGLRGRRFDLAEAVYVVDLDGRLVGVAPMAALLAAAPTENLGGLAVRAPAAHPLLDREKAAALARGADLASLPLIDGAGRFLGVVPGARLLDVVGREHDEDLNRLAGILHLENSARAAMEASPLRRARARLPWLLVGLAGSFIAAAVMARFEDALRDTLALAFFVPTIVYLADAIGTQTEVIAVRGLSLVHRPFWRTLRDELGVGAAIGTVLAALAFPAAWLIGGPTLAFVVSASVLVAGAAAATIGLALPWLLSRSGADPAYGSGPLATIIQDVLSLLVYFGFARLLL